MIPRPLRLRALLLLACPLLLAAAPADRWEAYYGRKLKIDDAHSVVAFAVPFLGLTATEGRFSEFTGTLFFDADDPTRSTVSVTVRTASLATGNEARDKDLRGADFFASEKYPVATFRSRRIERRDGGFVAVGDFSLHGVSREVAIPFTLTTPKPISDPWGNHRLALAGKLAIRRSDYGIAGQGRFGSLGGAVIGDEVEIRLLVQAGLWNVARWTLPERSIANPVAQTLSAKGIDAAVARYRELAAGEPQGWDFGEGQLNVLGHRLMQEKKVDAATAVFRLNAETHADSFNVYDDLADALAVSGDRAAAIAACRKSLAINPSNTDALESLRWLEAEDGKK